MATRWWYIAKKHVMPESLLKIRSLSISTPENILVDSISLTINKGTVKGLVGESGSGKTLTALSIMGLLPKGVKTTGGSIDLVHAKGTSDLLKLSSPELNKVRGDRISMIFQEPMTSLNPTMRCGDQAVEPLCKKERISKHEAKKKILELFREVRLPDEERIFSAWPHELSGGQRQRVMIAMALSTNPDLLIADEPTTALDVTVQKNILDLLLHLKDKFNLAILFITHDLMVLKQIADDIAVMYQGKILEAGPAEKILTVPETAYAKGLIACRPMLLQPPGPLPTVSDFMNGPKPGSDISYNINTKKSDKVLLSVRELLVTFPRKNGEEINAVDTVTFDVKEGETLGLVGESGCGKTTLGRSILQLIHARSGQVTYRGIVLNHLKGKELRQMRRKIQIVFQDPYSSLNPGKTIGNIISEPMLIHGLSKNRKEAEEKTKSLLEQVGLTADASTRYPHQFSGGQRQRIGIARALACQPEFIILDESVSALDVSVQAQILNLLNELKTTFNLTYIFISHDLTVVKYMSDRVLVMSEGRIIESGTSDKIYMNPSEAYTRKLIDAIPV